MGWTYTIYDPSENFITQLCNFCFLPDETGTLLLKTAKCHSLSDDYHGVEDIAHSPVRPSYLMISGFISLPCQYEETQEAFETVWTEQISAGLCFHNGEPTLSHTLAKYFFYVCFASVWPLGGIGLKCLALIFTHAGFRVWEKSAAWRETKVFIWLKMKNTVQFIHSDVMKPSVCYSACKLF